MAAAQKSSILDKTGQPYALPDAKSKARAMAAYDAGDPFSQELMTWDPPTMSADSAYLPERERISARLHDLVRNDGWASGTVTSFVNAAIGSQFRLNSRPDYRALGISFEAARQLGKEIEAQWRQFANDPRCYADASRRTTVTGLFYQGFRHRIIDGETLMVPGYKPRPGWGWATNFRLVHPERLSNPNHAPDTAYLRGGVELDDDGAAVAYHFRKAHPGDWHMMASDFYAWERVARETAWGRPQVIHYFLPTEAEETRGISPLAPVVRRMKMNQKYESAELQAAVANAVLAAYIETSLPPEAAADLLSGQNEWENHNERRMDFYEEAPVKLNGMRIPVLPSGDGIKMPMASRPNREAADFVNASLRNLSAASGLNPSTISRDYSQTNYSSERAAMLEAWRTITAERSFFAQGLASPMLLCFLEETFDRGYIDPPPGAPDFWEAPAAYLQGDWIGPGRGWVDPVKEAVAAGTRRVNRVSTLARENAEQGQDWEETLEQLAAERREMEELGLGPMDDGETAYRETDSEGNSVQVGGDSSDGNGS